MKASSIGMLITPLILVASASEPAMKVSASQPTATNLMSQKKSNSDRSKKSDEQYAFACRLDALDASQRKRHSELTRMLKAGVKRTLELKDGFALQLDPDPTTVVSTAEWVTLERRCCSFFRFELELESDDGAFWLRITGREGVKDFLRSELGLKKT